MISANITLINKDTDTTLAWSNMLEGEPVDISNFQNISMALAHLRNRKSNLVIIGAPMPVMQCFDFVKELRKFTNTPVLCMGFSSEEDALLLLKIGADDVLDLSKKQALLKKHFFLGRIEALIRRTHNMQDMPASDQASIRIEPEEIFAGKLVLNTVTHLHKWDKERLTLTFTEFSIVKMLTSPVEIVRSREALAKVGNIYGDEKRNVDSHIKKIRQKFEALDSRFNHIQTVSGLGYKYTMSPPPFKPRKARTSRLEPAN